MARIALLPPAVQGQIAAGEVIERPASVVKELVENALDAGARRIEIQLANGGLDRIVVRDDGSGIAAEDACVAFERHATSKLVTIDDLDDVATLGFRGEALASIAAVSRVRLATRRADTPAGTLVRADASGATPAGPAGGPVGTTITVEDLFVSVPARRKFVKSPSTEAGHVVEWVQRLAVAHPGVGFRIEHDRRVLLDHPAVNDVGQRIAQILGAQRAEHLIDLAPGAGGLRIWGRLGAPRETLSTSRLLWTYVAIGDGALRWVRDKLLLRAVLDGYESLVMRGRYPIAMLFLHVPPGEVDVNVHPAKLEVRFRHTTAIHQLIAPAIRARLAAALKPAVPAGVGAAAADPTADIAAAPPSAWGGRSAALEAPGLEDVVPGWDTPVTTEPAAVDDAAAFPPAGTTIAAPQPPPAWNAPPEVPAFVFGARPAPAERSAAVPPRQSALWQPAPEGYAALRYVGQVFDGYLLCEGRGRVVLIDQHAAHERVAFERLTIEHRDGGIARDALLVPEAIALAPAEVATLADHADVVAAAGFEGEPFGDGTYLLRTVPRLLRGRDVGATLRAVAAELNEEGASSAAQAAIDHVLSTMACHSVVRVGHRLAGSEVDALLRQMDEVDVNAHCPHGRPVSVELSRAQVEALFRR